MIRRLLMTLLISLLALGAVACQKRLSPEEESRVQALVGKTMYTQTAFHHEKGRHRTTNYQRGALVKINTPVKIIEIAGREAIVELPTGERVTILNHEDHTGKSIVQIVERMFSPTKVNLSKFTSMERRNIEDGEVAVGMRKDAVIHAMGYPPVTYTASTENDQWRYWKHRYDTVMVHFKNGKVSRIEN